MIFLKVLKVKYLRLIIISIFVAILFTPSYSFSQDSNLYNIAQRNLPRISLHTNRNHIQINELIRFTIEPESLATVYEFKFNFGDRTEEIKRIGKSSILHGFSTAGSYTVSVWLNAGEYFLPLDSINIKVDSVDLTINPENVFVGQNVNIKTKFETAYRVKFRFFSDNDSPLNDWSNISETNYKFLRDGIYNIHAKVGQQLTSGVSQIVSSVKRQVKVLPVTINLTADKYITKVNDSIKFSVLTNPENENFRYLFNFGDLSPKELINEPTIQHTFKEAGNYNVTAQLVLDNATLPYVSINKILINALNQPISIDLHPDKHNAATNENITFTVFTKNKEAGIDYLFDFGDNSPTQRTTDSVVQHIYKNKGNYIASVQLLLNNMPQQIWSITNMEINLAETLNPSNEKNNEIPFWVYLIGGLLILTSYKIKTKPKGSKWWLPFRSTFHVFYNQGIAKLADEKKFAVNFEYRLNPNFSESNYQIKTSNENLIKSIRREK